MIQDVQVIPLVQHTDERGHLTELLRASDQHFVKFGQVYVVSTGKAGTVRAFHKHAVQWEWFYISHGHARFVLVDDRPDSTTYGEQLSVVIGEDNPCLLVIPPGVHHGHMPLEDDTQLVAVTSDVYNRERPDEVRVPANSFGVEWKLTGNAA